MIQTQATVVKRNGTLFIALPKSAAKKLHAKTRERVLIAIDSIVKTDHARYSAVDPKEGEALYRALQAMYG